MAKFKVWCTEYGSKIEDAREFDAFDAGCAARNMGRPQGLERGGIFNRQRR